jgi:hypothetical protein
VARYVEDDEKLCKFLASLQLLPRLPRLLVIDDVSSFVGDKDPKRIARVMAFIKEAATYAATKSYSTSPPGWLRTHPHGLTVSHHHQAPLRVGHE